MGENEDLTDFKGEKMENLADTSAFNAGVKEIQTGTVNERKRLSNIRLRQLIS